MLPPVAIFSINSSVQILLQDVDWFLTQAETVWQQLWGTASQPNNSAVPMLLNLKSSEPANGQLSTQLEQLIEYTRAQQAQRQAEATQQVAETAAWWLFGTAFFSAAASALAGALSIRG